MVRYTRELLEEAARMTTNATDAVLWCGGKPTPGSRSYLRKKMAEAGVDITHFTNTPVRHTEEKLRVLVARSTSVADVVRGWASARWAATTPTSPVASPLCASTRPTSPRCRLAHDGPHARPETV